MTEINIEGFKNQLGQNYWLVKIIWEQICEEYFCLQCADRLEENETPIDECTELEKVVIACIAYLESSKEDSAIEEKEILRKCISRMICDNHKISQEQTITIKGFFFIVAT